jgi:putative restriction endonuclease
MSHATGVEWTREHRLVALNLYFKLPFGRLKKENPVIREVAAKMGRTSSSLSMKLCNFASFDPVLQARGINGLNRTSKADLFAWNEFQSNLSVLGPESEQLLHDLVAAKPNEEVDLLQPDRLQLESDRRPNVPMEPTETVAGVKVRRGQQFFRQSILSAYGVRCCVSGINVPRLLVASHIKPWADFPAERLDPRNGLCLSTLHDAAFDSGLFTLDENLCVILSGRLRHYFPQPSLEKNFVPYEGQTITRPDKLAEPSFEFLRYHRETIFQA